MKLKSLGDKTTQVALLSGHCIVVPPEGRDVPQMFVSEALRCGCVPMGIEEDDVKPAGNVPEGKEKGQIIVDGIKAMLEADCNLTGAGLPNLKDLAKQVGFTVSREEMVAAWDVIQKEAEAGDNS